MNVFISWSGEPSGSIAKMLRDQLPIIVQGINVFLSSGDIDSGDRWDAGITNALEKSDYGIICLSPTNQNGRWILFEAGALAKHLNLSHVSSLLCGRLTHMEVEPPLSRFQSRRFNEKDLFALISDLAEAAESGLTTDQLTSLFDKYWPEWKKNYQAILEEKSSKAPVEKRPLRETLEEVLITVRGLERSLLTEASRSAISMRGRHFEELLKAIEKSGSARTGAIDLDRLARELEYNSDEKGSG